MKHYLGIDPGQTGALALLNQEGSAISIWDMPPNIRELANLVRSLPEIHRAAIEEPFPGEKMSKISAMTYGMGIGEIRGMLAISNIRFVMVAPQKWQRVFNVTGKSRGNDSIGQCLKLYPEQELIVDGKRLHGRSDALLIARWIWKQG